MAFLTEADTCRRYVLPKLYAAGWTDEQISEQRSFTDGRIVVVFEDELLAANRHDRSAVVVGGNRCAGVLGSGEKSSASRPDGSPAL